MGEQIQDPLSGVIWILRRLTRQVADDSTNPHNLSEQLGAITFLRYLAPFYYYIHLRTLAGISFDALSTLTLLIGALLAGAAAWWLYLRRDIGGVSLARVHHSRALEETHIDLAGREAADLHWTQSDTQRRGDSCRELRMARTGEEHGLTRQGDLQRRPLGGPLFNGVLGAVRCWFGVEVQFTRRLRVLMTARLRGSRPHLDRILQPVEEFANLVVRARREVVVPLSDAEEHFRDDQADELVNTLSERCARLWRGDWESDHEPSGLLSAHR
jgi:hypothetical protein